jgi:RecB family exonuclease
MQREPSSERRQLLAQIEQLARRAIHGTLTESYRTCGNPRCRCHGKGPKHGPHLYVSYRGETGKTTGYYVPKAAENQVRHGVDAWNQLQKQLRQLATLNKERALSAARAHK